MLIFDIEIDGYETWWWGSGVDRVLIDGYIVAWDMMPMDKEMLANMRGLDIRIPLYRR